MSSKKKSERLEHIKSALLLSAFILFVGFSVEFSMIDLNKARIGHSYNTEQVQQFDQSTLKGMSNDFTSSSSDAQRYNKNKSNTFKKMILNDALTDNDLNTLIQIYQKDPTKVNKIYVLACAWNNKYDRDNLTKYGKSLNYYTQNLTSQDKKLISPYLQRIIESSNSDPTGFMQKLDTLGMRPDTPIIRTAYLNRNIH